MIGCLFYRGVRVWQANWFLVNHQYPEVSSSQEQRVLLQHGGGGGRSLSLVCHYEWRECAELTYVYTHCMSCKISPWNIQGKSLVKTTFELSDFVMCVGFFSCRENFQSYTASVLRRKRKQWAGARSATLDQHPGARSLYPRLGPAQVSGQGNSGR